MTLPMGNIYRRVPAKLARYPQLFTLITEPPATSRYLTFEELEMLEAELTNQSIVNPNPERTVTLAQFALLEMNTLRWRALRSGCDSNLLAFRIDLTRYLSRMALGLIHPTTPQEQALFWRAGLTGQDRVDAELAYLENFASFLNGGFENAENRYQQGLNVVLRVLSSSQPAADDPSIILPIPLTEFLSAIREDSAET